VDATDYYDGFGTGEIVIGIRAYQWGWEYFYPKSINLNYNVKPSYSTLVGNSIKYNNSSAQNSDANSFRKSYQGKSLQNLSVSPAQLVTSPSDNNGLVNLSDFYKVGLSSMQDSSAFKKIQYHSKSPSTSLFDSSTVGYSKFGVLSSLYNNNAKLINSKDYYTDRQDSYSALLSTQANLSSSLESNSVSKYLDYNFNLSVEQKSNSFALSNANSAPSTHFSDPIAPNGPSSRLSTGTGLLKTLLLPFQSLLAIAVKNPAEAMDGDRPQGLNRNDHTSDQAKEQKSSKPNNSVSRRVEEQKSSELSNNTSGRVGGQKSSEFNIQSSAKKVVSRPRSNTHFFNASGYLKRNEPILAQAEEQKASDLTERPFSCREAVTPQRHYPGLGQTKYQNSSGAVKEFIEKTNQLVRNNKKICQGATSSSSARSKFGPTNPRFIVPGQPTQQPATKDGSRVLPSGRFGSLGYDCKSPKPRAASTPGSQYSMYYYVPHVSTVGLAKSDSNSNRRHITNSPFKETDFGSD
jgi:hypothetical protein